MEPSRLNILLVEDNPGDVRLLKTYLAEAGGTSYDLTQADRLSAALTLLAKTDFDVILLDLGLPDAQGIATFNPIHAAASRTPILILTGLEDDAIARELVQSGAQDYLIKGRVDDYHLPRAITYAIKRKQTEEALRESEERLTHMLANSPTVIYALKVEAGQAKPTWVSDNIEAVLGFSVEAGLNPEWWSGQIYPKDWAEALAALDHIFDDFYQHEYRFFHQDGRLIWLHDEHRLLRDAENQPWEIIGAWTDITARKQAEEAMKEYNTRLEAAVEERTHELREALEKLVRQERLAVLGQMAGSVGHELRNPLGIVNNAIYYLRLAHPNMQPKVKEYLGIIETEIHNADKIITDLLDFSRIKSVDVEPVVVSELVRGTLERFPPPENVQLTLNLSENLPTVYVDPRQMTQVLGNLVLNACQAMPKSGTLTLSAKKKGEMVAIAVADTGIGIPPENIKKLFEPLFTTKAKGIGLGLAVSQRLVDANGGRIEVESEPGKGSTFTVFLPIFKTPD